MLPVDEARARIMARMMPVSAETVPLPDGLGRVLAQPVIARLTQPPHDMSAMDGYAMAGGEMEAAVIGAAPAGHPYRGSVGPGQAIRLFTGSVIPDGADAVVAQEDVTVEGGRITLRTPAVRGQHIRRGGQDFHEGQTLIPAGTRLGARGIGLAAAGNCPWLHVYRRPKVAILATGDEISLPGDPMVAGGIVSSNAHALAALVRIGGGDPVVLPIARDDRTAIATATARLGADLLLTTGGASVGDHDLVQTGLMEARFVLDFWQVAMRPGKPLLFGMLGATPVLGVPGNPVSAFVCAVLFLMPALARLGGAAEMAPRDSRGRLTVGVPANDRRADHLRATVTEGSDLPLVTPFQRQDSSLLHVLYSADALVFRAPHAVALEAGAEIEMLRLDWAGY